MIWRNKLNFPPEIVRKWLHVRSHVLQDWSEPTPFKGAVAFLWRAQSSASSEYAPILFYSVFLSNLVSEFCRLHWQTKWSVELIFFRRWNHEIVRYFNLHMYLLTGPTEMGVLLLNKVIFAFCLIHRHKLCVTEKGKKSLKYVVLM